jgi:hypothetical protein
MYLAELARDRRPGLEAGGAPHQDIPGAVQEFVLAARKRFDRVRCLKPEASRARSPETYLLAMGARMV